MKIKILLFFLLLIGFGCENNGDGKFQEDAAYSVTELSAPAPIEEMDAAAVRDYKKVSNTAGENLPAPVPEKKLIKNGSMRMQVKDYAKTRTLLAGLIAENKGYISSENETNTTSSLQNNITIRLPFNNFDALVSGLEKHAEYVESKNINVEDVTARFVDIEARLKTKKEVENRYRDLLSRAKTIPDILKVEEQIRILREEIEAAEGQLKLMRNQIQLSTLHLTIYQELPYTIAPKPETGFFAKVADAFANGWRILLSFIVGLIYLWPFLLVAAVILFLLERDGRRIRKS